MLLDASLIQRRKGNLVPRKIMRTNSQKYLLILSSNIMTFMCIPKHTNCTWILHKTYWVLNLCRS